MKSKKAHLMLALLIGLSPLSGLFAQSAHAQNNEAFRLKAPTLPAPRPFVLPKVKTIKLENGLEVKLLEDHRFPVVTACLGIRSGKVLDKDDSQGIAKLTATMLTEGTDKRTSKEIASEIDYIGGSLGASCDYDFTLVSGSCLSNYTPRLMSLFHDVALHPSFPDEEMKLKKTNWLQELILQRAEPSYLLEERFRHVIFGANPYGRVSPKPEMIEKISKEDLRKFHSENYIPNNSLLLVVGDFDSVAMESTIKESFGKDWAKGDIKENVLVETTPISAQKIYLVNRPGSVQSSIKLGNLGIKKTDPDYFKILVMNDVLGGSAHSRLFENIRESKGYTYGAYSSSAARVHPDVFSAQADVRTEVTAPSLQEFLYELDRIRNVKVSQEELDAAKSYLAGLFQLRLETQSGLAQALLDAGLYKMPDDYLENYTKNIMAVTVDDVRNVARKVISSGKFVITVVGDAKKIQPDLEMFAPVEVYSVDGKLSKSDGHI
ncbi:MAG: pitrilysin family protein [Candidatus Melainabacteria bacterium]|nr:pitrilysin family protein [Candidatus Melainabacteria bacterium]